VSYGPDPLDSAPALIGIIVGIFVWLRYRADRRARVFLALAAAEFLGGFPLVMLLVNMREGPLPDALTIGWGMLSAALFLHFGSSFPHARAWVRRDGGSRLYAGALALTAWALLVTLSEWPGLTHGMLPVAIGVVASSLAACVFVSRSYREMTRDERARYRVPITGVAAGMAAAVLSDVFIGFLSLGLDGDRRYVVWSMNVLSMAGELLMPLFFFMAASKYGLLDHHSQDYVAKL
jgi:hypothetical protein